MEKSVNTACPQLTGRAAFLQVGQEALQFATVPTRPYGLSDPEKAGGCHLSPHLIYHYSWPVALAPPADTCYKNSSLHKQQKTEKANNLHIGIVHLSPIRTQRIILP